MHHGSFSALGCVVCIVCAVSCVLRTIVSRATLRDGGRIVKVLGHQEMAGQLKTGAPGGGASAWWAAQWRRADIVVLNLGHHLRNVDGSFNSYYRTVLDALATAVANSYLRREARRMPYPPDPAKQRALTAPAESHTGSQNDSLRACFRSCLPPSSLFASTSASFALLLSQSPSPSL
mgnify:CR=1 FL=1